MVRAARWLCGISVVLLGGFYVAAKIHFFTRFFELPLDAYWKEHWPFTASLVILTGVVAALATYLDRANGRRE